MDDLNIYQNLARLEALQARAVGGEAGSRLIGQAQEAPGMPTATWQSVTPAPSVTDIPSIALPAAQAPPSVAQRPPEEAPSIYSHLYSIGGAHPTQGATGVATGYYQTSGRAHGILP